MEGYAAGEQHAQLVEAGFSSEGHPRIPAHVASEDEAEWLAGYENGGLDYTEMHSFYAQSTWKDI